MATPWYDRNITQGFKWSRDNTHAHSGIDLGMGVGTPLTAPMPGSIVSQGFEPWGGQVNEAVTINGQIRILSFLHTSELAPHGEGPVQPGAAIGASGSPPPGYGNGPHLHFEETAGNTPPYMGYNPWYPTAKSYPIDPTVLLASIRAGHGDASGSGNPTGDGGGGTLQGSNSIIDSGFAGAAGGVLGPLLWPLFAGAAGATDIPGAITKTAAAVTASVIDGMKRAAVFVLGVLCVLFGVILLAWPAVKPAVQVAGKAAAVAAA